MPPASRPRPRAAVVAFALALLWPVPASASGFDAVQIGSARSGPVTRDAAAVYYNPAQLGYLRRAELGFGLGVIAGGVSYRRERRGQYQFADNLDFAEPIDPADLDPTRTGWEPPVRATPVGPDASLFAVLPVIPNRFTLGLGLAVPYAAILDLPAGGPQRFALQRLQLFSLECSLAAGIRLHDVISIGAGVSYMLSNLELAKVQDFGAVDVFGRTLADPPIGQANDFGADAPTTVRELDVLARPFALTNAWSHAPSFHVGLAIRPSDRVDLAIVYRHGAHLRFHGDFALDMNDDFFTQDLANEGLHYPPLVRGRARVEMRLPKRLTVGLGWNVHERVRLELLGAYVAWQELDRIDIRLSSPALAQPALGVGETVRQPLVRDWQGAFVVELAPRVQVTRALDVTTLIGYHSPAAPASTLDMASPDGHRVVFGAGLGYAFHHRFTLRGDFEGQAIAPRRGRDSEYDLGNGRYRIFLGRVGLTAVVTLGELGRRAAS